MTENKATNLENAGKSNPNLSALRSTAGVTSHLDMALGMELGRNALSRQRYELLLRVILPLICVNILLIFIIFYQVMRPVEYRYFTTDGRGAVREITALNRQIQTDEEVLNWATLALTRSYSMSFANYNQQLGGIKENFTSSGWSGFETALQRAGFIEALTKNQYVTNAVPKRAPVVVAKGLAGDVYGWRLQIPLLITFTSANNTSTQDVNIEMTIVRRAETEHPSGLGIAQIISN